jgi:hypothetical protein
MAGRRQISERPGAVLADDSTLRNRYIANIPIGLTESRPLTRTRAGRNDLRSFADSPRNCLDYMLVFSHQLGERSASGQSGFEVGNVLATLLDLALRIVVDCLRMAMASDDLVSAEVLDCIERPFPAGP